MLEEFKKLIDIPDEKKELANFIIDAVNQKVLNYINHETLPKELEYDVKLMIIASYNTIKTTVDNTQSAANLTKVKRGDTEWNYEKVYLQVYDLLEGNNFFGYRASLNMFRKLRK